MMTNQSTSSPPAPERPPALSSARIETLADGVFAIVMTLLVFDMRVPVQEAVVQVGLPQALLQLVPNLISYVISFVILGVLWVGHHNQFFYIRRADRTLLWINILFMMCIALLPFSAALLSRYGTQQIAVMIYDANLIAAGLVLYLHWWYGTRDRHLLGHELDPKIDRLVKRRILFPPLLYFISSLLSFFRVEFGIALDILIPLIYILPTGIDQAWRARGSR
jgi:uncharacterized membrane protein